MLNQNEVCIHLFQCHLHTYTSTTTFHVPSPGDPTVPLLSARGSGEDAHIPSQILDNSLPMSNQTSYQTLSLAKNRYCQSAFSSDASEWPMLNPPT